MRTSSKTPSLSISGWRIEPVGDRCLQVRLGDRVGADTSRTVQAVAAHLSSAQLPGVVDVVPAFTTVALHYRPLAFDRRQGVASSQLTRLVEQLLAGRVPERPVNEEVIEIPACYGGDYGPDLDDVARHCGLTAEEVIALHSGTPLSLYAYFFAPGNPFFGPLDPRLNVPRRSTPRLRVEAGSVAIANGISSIYQMALPGGWNVIARTPWDLFDVTKTPPTRMPQGARVRFYPISASELERMQERPP
ncbi:MULTISPECIES: 5-oxoprolinase subunit PxpB [unclassified Variovorax]|uniref:5-oxoprolinase subunit PxpB n=1 Tax=unclassified Variovorax TaxID=663243 RepID=UPI000B82B5FF|nr:5-oxoprolinase subunit PxpB [Variovorax sp. CF079]